jgi:hypothetical protein
LQSTPRTLWASGLRRWLKAPFRKGVGSNPAGVIFCLGAQPVPLSVPSSRPDHLGTRLDSLSSILFRSTFANHFAADEDEGEKQTKTEAHAKSEQTKTKAKAKTKTQTNTKAHSAETKTKAAACNLTLLPLAVFIAVGFPSCTRFILYEPSRVGPV